MGKKTILIDLDSTLVDLTSKWLPLYNSKYGDNLKENDINSWDVSKCAKEGKLVYEVLNEPGFFKTLDPFPGAIDFIEDLNDTGNYNILIATHPVTNPQSWSDKYEWYLEYLGFLGKDNFAALKQKELIKSDIYFDDNPGFIRACRNNWPDSFIMTWKYGWNKEVWDLCNLTLCNPRSELAWYKLFEIIEEL